MVFERHGVYQNHSYFVGWRWEMALQTKLWFWENVLLNWCVFCIFKIFCISEGFCWLTL